MPRSRGGRDTARIASSAAPPPSDFDDEWLSLIRERFDARYIDLTKIEDRRRWHPSALNRHRVKPFPKGIFLRPRIIIVPEGHRLARHQTYGGRYSLAGIRAGWKYRVRNYADEWVKARWPYGKVRRYVMGDVSRRVGFSLPWQVVICVRRKRRREVMHALGIAGRRGIGAGQRHHRNEYSNVRC